MKDDASLLLIVLMILEIFANTVYLLDVIKWRRLSTFIAHTSGASIDCRIVLLIEHVAWWKSCTSVR